MLSWEKTILHIDYDSFFASVEQQANPFLRGKPIGVTGSSLTRGIICAASREAKKFGVKTGMPLFKAREICPQIMPVKGDSTKYWYIHKKTHKIFGKYSDLVEPFSIDESFLDITKTVKFFRSPEDLALQIKKDIEDSFGPYVTCSIGIGPNKLMAKLVSDLKKPNGLFVVTPNNLAWVQNNVRLTDFCGIGRRINARLENLNILNVWDLQQATYETLENEFGPAEAKFLKNLSQGVGDEIVKTVDYTREVKSISHQHTLSKNTKDMQVLRTNLKRLVEMVGRRLRAKNLKAKTLYVAVQDSKRHYFGQRTTLKHHTSTTRELYEEAEKLFTTFNWNKETRFVSFGVSNLTEPVNTSIPLFPWDRNEQKISNILDVINDKWGDFSLVTASTITADRTKGKISSFLKH